MRSASLRLGWLVKNFWHVSFCVIDYFIEIMVRKIKPNIFLHHLLKLASFFGQLLPLVVGKGQGGVIVAILPVFVFQNPIDRVF